MEAVMSRNSKKSTFSRWGECSVVFMIEDTEKKIKENEEEEEECGLGGD